MADIPNFADVPYAGTKADADLDAWKARVQQETAKSPDEMLWSTPEQLDVKPLYTAADLDGLDHLQTMPGLPPFLRGPYSTMYAMRPWTVRQYAGFSTAEESNAFYRRNLAAGQKGL